MFIPPTSQTRRGSPSSQPSQGLRSPRQKGMRSPSPSRWVPKDSNPEPPAPSSAWDAIHSVYRAASAALTPTPPGKSKEESRQASQQRPSSNGDTGAPEVAQRHHHLPAADGSISSSSNSSSKSSNASSGTTGTTGIKKTDSASARVKKTDSESGVSASHGYSSTKGPNAPIAPKAAPVLVNPQVASIKGPNAPAAPSPQMASLAPAPSPRGAMTTFSRAANAGQPSDSFAGDASKPSTNFSGGSNGLFPSAAPQTKGSKSPFPRGTSGLRGSRKLALVTKLTGITAMGSMGMILCLLSLWRYSPLLYGAGKGSHPGQAGSSSPSPPDFVVPRLPDELLIRALQLNDSEAVGPTGGKEATSVIGIGTGTRVPVPVPVPVAGKESRPGKHPTEKRGQSGRNSRKGSQEGLRKGSRAQMRSGKAVAESRPSESKGLRGRGDQKASRAGMKSDGKEVRRASRDPKRSPSRNERARREDREMGRRAERQPKGQKAQDKKKRMTNLLSTLTGRISRHLGRQNRTGTLLGSALGNYTSMASKIGVSKMKGGSLFSAWLRRGGSSGSASFRMEKRGCPKLPGPAMANGTVLARHYPEPRTYSRKECRCVPVHNFVILSMQRSGSGWFETFLNSHPNISSFGEIFGKSRGKTANLADIIHALDKVYNLDWKNSASKDGCTVAAGFKWMLNQGAMAHHEEISEYFKKNHVSVIMLVRRNVLRRLISILANAYDRKKKLLNGQHKSHVHKREEARILAEYKPRLGVRHLLGNLQRVQQIVDDALRAFNGTRMRVLAYEEVLKDKMVLKDVQQFIGAPVRELTSRQVKIHTKPLNESVANYEDVAKKLRGTPLEFVLNEDYA